MQVFPYGEYHFYFNRLKEFVSEKRKKLTGNIKVTNV